MSLVSELLKRRDVPEDEWRSTIAEILEVSYGTATKRLTNEEEFSLEELFKIARHFGTTVSAMLQAAYAEERLSADEKHNYAQLQIGEHAITCNVMTRPGAQRGGNLLVAYQTPADAWCVCHASMAPPEVDLYSVRQLTFTGPRIAVVDDEAPTTLVRFLATVGFEATHFSEPGPVLELLRSSNRPDAYILDWTLDGGETSQGLIEAIRRVDPTCPIVLLTGTIQSQRRNESDIARVMGQYNVEFYEKPTRYPILAEKLRLMLGRQLPLPPGYMGR
jgi:CheY-like chemotaxis protein